MSFKYPTKCFVISTYYKKKTYRMGFLGIPTGICIWNYSCDSQGCRFLLRYRESFLIHKHSVFTHNKKTRRQNVSQMTWKIRAIKLCKFKLFVFHSNKSKKQLSYHYTITRSWTVAWWKRKKVMHLKVFIIEITTKRKACQYNDIKTEKREAMYTNSNLPPILCSAISCLV